MKEFELPIIETLIKFYNKYLKEGPTEEIKIIARKINNTYIALTMIHDETAAALGPVFSIGYPNVVPGYKEPTKEEIHKIINNLKKLKKKLKLK